MTATPPLTTEAGSPLEVTRTYLEMTDPAHFRPAAAAVDAEVRIERVIDCPASFYRYLYREVGRPYHWIDLLEAPDQAIREGLLDPAVSLWVMYRSGAPAGFYRLQREADDSIEISYFGLLPEFVGKGLGGHLLNSAIARAWADGARRVWLHTCTLDHAAALPNYQRRGFRPYRTETYTTTVSPDRCDHCRALG